MFWIYFYCSGVQENVERNYMTFIDMLANIGGMIDMLVIPLILLYWVYSGTYQEKNIIHGGLMMSGKYDIGCKQFDFLKETYPEYNYINPFHQTEESHMRWWHGGCCKKKVKSKYDAC